jgi:flagellar biosynthesis protein FliR
MFYTIGQFVGLVALFVSNVGSTIFSGLYDTFQARTCPSGCTNKQEAGMESGAFLLTVLVMILLFGVIPALVFNIVMYPVRKARDSTAPDAKKKTK